MKELFTSFPNTSKIVWEDVLHQELKGASPDTLHKFNAIEEIVIPSFFHRDDAIEPQADPGKFPYSRGNKSDNNDWNIGATIQLTENDKTNNGLLLNALMTGNTALVLHATSEKTIDFEVLFDEIQLQYIHTTFYPKTAQQGIDFIAKAESFPSSVVFKSSEEWISVAQQTKHKVHQPFGVNGFQVHQAGGTTWQEIAISLAEAHELLLAQIQQGLTVDEAAGNIHFVLGIGSSFFYEIAKFRAFRSLWTKVVSAYKPEHRCSNCATVTAQTGLVYMSVNDPYTNLLRQTTQALSAVIGGVNQLNVIPYDLYTNAQKSGFTDRMATNISLVLKEESYMDKVIDPAGGSYAIDQLTDTIAERAWTEFQAIERGGGINNESVRSKLAQEITEKAQQRVALYRDKKATLIGVTIFPNPEKLNANWKTLPKAWNNLPTLNLENELTI